MRTTNRALIPKERLSYVEVYADLPGASAMDMERFVTFRLEEALTGMDQVGDHQGAHPRVCHGPDDRHKCSAVPSANPRKDAQRRTCRERVRKVMAELSKP